MTRGKFITFEGGDGVGKSMQIAMLSDRLQEHGVNCVVSREPGGTPFAEEVRRLILSGELPAHSPLSEACLFASARVDHVSSFIAPALAAGKWVLCDRFADSTRAYQGAGGGASREALQLLEELTHPGCTPDLTIVLDLDPRHGRERIAARRPKPSSHNDPFEGRDLEFQDRLRAAFLEIAAEEPERCVVVDASLSAEHVAASVWQRITERFTAVIS